MRRPGADGQTHAATRVRVVSAGVQPRRRAGGDRVRDNTARVWDAATGAPIGKPMQHEDIVNSAEFSPDGARVVTASGDKTARVWDATTGAPIGRPLQHDELVWERDRSARRQAGW